ncbi:hypothetical protein BDD12DRAFT_886152 [Trichophaea hybrida]|nr:hypothetical protein BDD12DRAFT_886152 [Trichophaea hybrida]
MSVFNMTHQQLDVLLASSPVCKLFHVQIYTGESEYSLRRQFDNAWRIDWPGREDYLERLHIYIDGTMSFNEIMTMNADVMRWVEEWVDFKISFELPWLDLPPMIYCELGSVHPNPNPGHGDSHIMGIAESGNAIEIMDSHPIEYLQADTTNHSAVISLSMEAENPFINADNTNIDPDISNLSVHSASLLMDDINPVLHLEDTTKMEITNLVVHADNDITHYEEFYPAHSNNELPSVHADDDITHYEGLYPVQINPDPASINPPRANTTEGPNIFSAPEQIRRPNPTPQPHQAFIDLELIGNIYSLPSRAESFPITQSIPVSQPIPVSQSVPISQSIPTFQSLPAPPPNPASASAATRILLPTGKHACSFCHKEYKSASICDRHIMEHTVGKHPCPFRSDGNCGRATDGFARYDKLREHVEKRHKGVSLDDPRLRAVYDNYLHRGRKIKEGALKQNRARRV